MRRAAGTNLLPAALCASLVTTMTTSCALGSSRGEGFQESPHQVVVVMADYRYELRPTVKAGRIVVLARNEGRVDHELVLARIPPDFPPIDEQLRGDVRRQIPQIALIPRRAPGEQGTFAVDLTPGRYALICYLRDDDGVQHYLKGMSAELRVV